MRWYEMEHFIIKIQIDKLRHLSNIEISLKEKERQHLLITGKNGSGKTTLLLALKQYLSAINDSRLDDIKHFYKEQIFKRDEELQKASTEEEKFEIERKYSFRIQIMNQYKNGIEVEFAGEKDLDAYYAKGKFITAFYAANRKTDIIRPSGVENVKLEDVYGINADPGNVLLKYMVHLKTQQSYARNEGDVETANRIQKWFERFEYALQVLLDEDSIKLEYDYREYNFKIHEKENKVFGFDELSDGYSAVIYIVSDLILRMDKNWILGDSLSEYNMEGIVLIDELETHLHIELQKKILPFLTKFFPRIQFVVTTHSPYILNSISNAKAYDLEKCVELENLSLYSADGLAESYFDMDEYSDELKNKVQRYALLVHKKDITEEERAERAKLRVELKNIPQGLATEARNTFEEIERHRL